MKVNDWDLIESALQLFQAGKTKAAETVLASALDLDVSNTTCGSNCCKEKIITSPATADNVAKDYGLNGYTDENDPRDAKTARSHIVDEAVHVIVHRNPSNQYKLSSVNVVGDKNGNGGRHVAKVRVPSNFSGQVILATGYNGNPDKFDNQITHSVGQEVVIDGKFSLPSLGPLAIFLRENGKRVSDVVGNLGLPDGHHVSYNLTFTE